MQHHQPATLPPWLFLMIGVTGIFMARGGLATSDLVRTVGDSMRTLMILAVIVFGCFMVIRDLSEQQQQQPCPRRIVQSPPPATGPPMVTMTTQQFKLLLDMASAAPTAAAVMPAEQVPVPAREEVQVAPEVVVAESQNSTVENSEVVS